MAEHVDVEKFYALVDTQAGKEVPWGLISQAGAIVKRWIPNKGIWVEAPRHWDYLIGSEPGAREVNKQAAERLKSAKTLKELPDENIESISH